MEFPNAFKWTVVNRLLTTGAILAGVALVVVGFVFGFWGSIELLLEAPLDPDVDAVVERANPVLTLAFAVLGFVVWQVGKTYALFRTLPRASGRAAARQFDHERVKSDVLEGLDGRLTKIEEDLEETRRSVHELKRATHADAFDADESLASDSLGDDSGAIGATNDAASAVHDSSAVEPTSRDDAESTIAGDTVGTNREVDDRTATAPRGNDGEFTFGETESTSDSTAVDDADERDRGRSTGENTTESEDDPFG